MLDDLRINQYWYPSRLLDGPTTLCLSIFGYSGLTLTEYLQATGGNKIKKSCVQSPHFGFVLLHLFIPHVNDAYSFVKKSVLNVDYVSVTECEDRINAMVL